MAQQARLIKRALVADATEGTEQQRQVALSRSAMLVIAKHLESGGQLTDEGLKCARLQRAQAMMALRRLG